MLYVAVLSSFKINPTFSLRPFFFIKREHYSEKTCIQILLGNVECMGVKILFILFYTLAMGVTHRLGTAGMKEKRMSASNTMIKNSWSYASTPRKY
jgi:hypothetical protein